MSICTHLLSGSEYVPPDGSTMCAELCRWWKSPCQRGCKHTPEYVTSVKRLCVGYVPTGTVVSKVKHPSGDITVRVRSHQQPQQGDKLSTGHGQKGVAVITDYHNMPIAHQPDQGDVVPDVVVAMSSIVTQQTNGQLYEAAKVMSALKLGINLPVVVGASEVTDVTAPVFVGVFVGTTSCLLPVEDDRGLDLILVGLCLKIFVVAWGISSEGLTVATFSLDCGMVVLSAVSESSFFTTALGFSGTAGGFVWVAINLDSRFSIAHVGLHVVLNVALGYLNGTFGTSSF